MAHERHVRLCRNGRNRAVLIPVEFELPGGEAIMRREGDKLVLEPIRKAGLEEWLATIEPWAGEFLDIRDEPCRGHLLTSLRTVLDTRHESHSVRLERFPIGLNRKPLYFLVLSQFRDAKWCPLRWNLL